MNNTSPPASRRKRRRKIWACNECRRRKIQCDREQPVCGGCRKAGQFAQCQYVDKAEIGTTVVGLGGVSNDKHISNSGRRVESVPSLLNQDVLEAHNSPCGFAAHERRLDLLEAKTETRRFVANNPTSTLGEAHNELTHDEHVLHGDCNYTVLHGRTFRTKFHGGTFPGTLAQSIPGLKDFTTDAFAAFPVLEEVRQAVSGSQQATFLASTPSSRATRTDLLKLLEHQESIDSDIQRYLAHHNHVYHIIHVPAFERDYAQMWLSREAADVRQLILVLLMVAVARYSDPSQPGNIGSWQQATAVVDVCEDVLQSSMQKYDTALDFQINFLLLLARQLSGKWYKRTWVNAGNMLRIWMCAGLHRNVSALNSKPTILTKELRARLWVAAADFELQAAFEHGMSGHTWPEQSDIAPPLNISDAALEQDRSPEESLEYTATTYLSHSAKSLRVRHRLNGLLNSAATTLTMSQVNEFTDELYRLANTLDQKEEPQCVVVNALLSINLLQYVLALHIRQLQHSSSMMEYRASRATIVESASRILRHHHTAIASGSQLIEAMYGDHVRVALSVCYCYLTADTNPDCIITMAIENRAFELMQAIAALMANKVKHVQGSRHHFWLTVAALGLMRAKQRPSQRMLYMDETVKLFVEPYSSLLQDQQTDQSAYNNAQSVQQSTLDHIVLGAPTQLDLSIDEWFYRWCDNPTVWPADGQLEPWP